MAGFGPRPAVFACGFARRLGRRLDGDPALVFAAGNRRAGQRRAEFRFDVAGNLEEGLGRGDADRADLVLGNVAAAAEQRQYPARIGILAAADVHAVPDGIVEAGAVMRLALAAISRLGGEVDHLLGARQAAAVRADQRQRDVFRGLAFQQLRRQRAFLVARLDRLHQRHQQAVAVLLADHFRRRHADPFGVDPRRAQHHLDPAAARIGHDQHGGALLARAPGAARTVLEHFGIARQFDVDHQAERGDIDAARGDIGGHADPRPLVAQGLQRMVALVLAVLARQRHRGKAAFDQPGMEMADIVARRAEQHRRFGFVDSAAG